MATPTKRPTRSPGTKAARKPHHEVALRIHLLLHTLRDLERREEDLCCLMHELERANRVPRDVHAELAQLLASPPFRSFQTDVDAIERALHSSAPRPARRKPAKTRRTPAQPHKASVRRSAKASAKQTRSRAQAKAPSR